jgi:hypothetical protein
MGMTAQGAGCTGTELNKGNETQPQVRRVSPFDFDCHDHDMSSRNTHWQVIQT